MRINVGRDTLVGLDNLLQINIDKVVEGIDMLLDKPLNFEERRQKLPFVLFAPKTMPVSPYSPTNAYHTISQRFLP